MSDPELAVLGDHVVTDQELLDARDHVKACLTSADIEVELHDNLERPSSISAVFPSEPEFFAAEKRCRTDVDAIEEVWILQNAPTPASLVQSRDSFAECMAALTGLDSTTSFEDALRALELPSADAEEDVARDDCINEYRRTATEPSPGIDKAWEIFTSEHTRESRGVS